jgi:hypothetical protein
MDRGADTPMTPFLSQAQRRWMYKNKPAMASEWESVTPKGKKLPQHVKKKKKTIKKASKKRR